MNNTYHVFITGVMGFIGFSLAKRLLEEGHTVTGIDLFDPLDRVADKVLRRVRILRFTELTKYPNFRYAKQDVGADRWAESLDREWDFYWYQFTHIFHFAGTSGIRQCESMKHQALMNNVGGFSRLLDKIQSRRLPNLQGVFYASSSSVYGGLPAHVAMTEEVPLSIPLSTYALSKMHMEQQAYLFNMDMYNTGRSLQAVGLRFFTVYGEYGRPDMAMWKFVSAALNGDQVIINGSGLWLRDMTYIDDALQVMLRLIDHAAAGDDFHSIINVGTGTNIQGLELIDLINEEAAKYHGRPVTAWARLSHEELNRYEMQHTLASSSLAYEENFLEIGPRGPFPPATQVKDGLKRFTNWYINNFKS